MTQVKSSARARRSNVHLDLRYIVTLDKGLHAGKFLVKAPNGRDELGKPLYKRYGPYADRAKAIEARDQHLARQLDLKRDTLPLGRQARAMTLAEWAEVWFTTVVRQQNAAGSYDRYKSSFDRHVLPALGGFALVDLTKMRVRKWLIDLAEQGIGREAINYALKRLKTCLQAALDEESIGLKSNVARSVKPLQRINREDDYEGHPSDYPLIDAALVGDWRRAFPIVGVDTGLRRSELAGLHWGDVDLPGRKLHIRWHFVTSGDGDNRVQAFRPGSKANQDGVIVPEVVYLSARAVAALEAHQQRLLEHKMATRAWVAGKVDAAFYADNKSDRTGRPFAVPQHPLAPEALVFPSADGTPWDPDSMGDWFTRLTKSVGLNKTCHGMRHDCGSFQLNAGVPITIVSKHLRHASVDITAKVYLHILRGTERDGADALDAVWANLEAQAAAV